MTLAGEWKKMSFKVPSTLDLVVPTVGSVLWQYSQSFPFTQERSKPLEGALSRLLHSPGSHTHQISLPAIPFQWRKLPSLPPPLPGNISESCKKWAQSSAETSPEHRDSLQLHGCAVARPFYCHLLTRESAWQLFSSLQSHGCCCCQEKTHQ